MMARPGRLEGHAPVQLAVRAIGEARLAAEVEILLAWLADGPAAVARLEVEELLGPGVFGDFPWWLAHVCPVGANPSSFTPDSASGVPPQSPLPGMDRPGGRRRASAGRRGAALATRGASAYNGAA